MNRDNIRLMNQSIFTIFKRALSISTILSGYLMFIIHTIFRLRKAARTRLQCEEEGLHVPPFLIFSITNKCNLKCKGCYAEIHNPSTGKQMSFEKQRSIFEEAKELGISIVFIAGGEPLVNPEILEVTKSYPEIIFPLFTNGILIDNKIVESLKKQKQVIPVISIEGDQVSTDDRRGGGVYESIQKTFDLLKRNWIFYGVSITVTKRNFNSVVNEAYMKELIQKGCRLFFFVEYVPVEQGTEELVVDDEQRSVLKKTTEYFSSKYQAIFITFPGDEEQYGGCLAAGRGFLHINPQGDVEPCPFAPYSDSSLMNMTLKQSLESGLLSTIRQNHDRLTETSSGCALWRNREWVESLLLTEDS